MLVLYKVLDGTITASKVMYKKCLEKMTGSLLLFL